MKRPPIVLTVVLKLVLMVELEDKKERSVLRFDRKVMSVVILFMEQLWER